MLSKLLPLLERAEKKRYAIPAFNVTDLETAQAVIAAAVLTKSPVIIQTSESAITYAGHKTILSIMEGVATDLGKKIPVVTHLDHGKHFSFVRRSLELGFASVHMDASAHDFKKNVTMTRRAVALGHRYKKAVQGEIGALLGYEGMTKLKSSAAAVSAMMTDPEQAQEFVKQTDIDTLAVAVGTAHGNFVGREKIDFRRLAEIKKRTRLPLVLHGGSGVAPLEIRRAITLGIRVINVDTVLRLRFMQGLAKGMKSFSKRSKVDIRVYLAQGRLTMEQEAIKLIKLFGSAGKA